MSQATKKTTLEDYLTREEFCARFAAEKITLARQYCTLFAFWRRCRLPLCRRERACGGDARACLNRSVQEVPRERQFAAREKLLAASPRNLPAPERAARGIMPGSLEDPREGLRTQDIPRGWRCSGKSGQHGRRGATR